ncbi:MAG: hypothetical protein ABID54_00800 [Pseudomonadota bacterium]
MFISLGACPFTLYRASPKLRDRFLAEFTLSPVTRFLTSFGMTGEGVGMTGEEVGMTKVKGSESRAKESE